MPEFGSSSCLLDELATNPKLASQFMDAIQELSTRPPTEKRYLGDLCKIGGVIHVWMGEFWMTIEEANELKFYIQR